VVLSKNKFYAHKKKCQFFQHELTFLGHVVSAEGLKVDPQKTRVVQEWPTPKNVHDVRSFLGLANYFRRCVQGYSNLVRPLTNLTRKSTEWQWSDECQRAFNDLKERLTTAPVLALPDPEKPYEVITDASGFGIGAVLMQEGRPIAFEGRKLSDAETRYAVHEQVCMASIHALNVWRCYLEGAKFTVVTDHHPNTFLLSQPKLSRRQARWSEFLSRFDFDWIYRPGRSNVADPISRIPQLILNVVCLTITRARWSRTPGDVAATIQPPMDNALLARIKQGYSSDDWFHDTGNSPKFTQEGDLWWHQRALIVPDFDLSLCKKDMQAVIVDTMVQQRPLMACAGTSGGLAWQRRWRRTARHARHASATSQATRTPQVFCILSLCLVGNGLTSAWISLGRCP